MLNYTVGGENSENGMICYYGEEDVLGNYSKRKYEEDEEVFDKGSRKKRYILGQNVGKWTDEEHSRFVLALKKFGRNWTLVQQEVKTRTLVQIRSHAQKYFLKKVRGIAPSTLTMDSKLISTASDGIVPTWLLQDDPNYANKSSINNINNSNKNNDSLGNNNNILNNNLDNSLNNSINNCNTLNINSSNNINHNLNNKLYIRDDGSNSDSNLDDNLNINSLCTSNINDNNNTCNSNSTNINKSNNTSNNLMVSNGLINNIGLIGSQIVDNLSQDTRYNYINNSLSDEHNREINYQNYKNYIDIKSETAPKYEYVNGSISKQIMNKDNLFDESYSDKRLSLESNSMASTAVSSPASIGPEKNYIPASSLGLDLILMPPTVDLNNNNNYSNVPFGNYSEKNHIRNHLNLLPESANYHLNYNINESENIINPQVSLSNSDVPWPITGNGQFPHFNDDDNIVSSSPSSSSSISYLDLDTTGSDSKQLSNNISIIQQKQYEINNSLSDFVYCGDSLGIDLLNIYTNLRDTPSPIISNADITDLL